MFLKINTAKTLIQIGYSKSGVANSETSATDADGVVTITYNYGSGNSCVECTDEDVLVRLGQLDDYVKSVAVTGDIYNIKWSDSKVSAVTGQDMAGEDITIQTHFSGDDTAKDARLLADEWVTIRTERDRLLTSTDWWGASDQTMSDDQKTYRVALRTLPADQSSKTTYVSITWPTKPS